MGHLRSRGLNGHAVTIVKSASAHEVFHLGQGRFRTPLKMAVPSNSALFEGIGGDFGNSQGQGTQGEGTEIRFQNKSPKHRTGEHRQEL